MSTSDKHSSQTLPSRLEDEITQASGGITVRELAERLELSPALISSTAARLANRGLIERVGRGIFAPPSKHHKSPAETSLPDDATKLVKILSNEGVSHQLSGYDVLAPFANQLPANWPPHLVYIERGQGDWAADLLYQAGYQPLLNPSRTHFKAALDLQPDHLVVIREMSLRDRGREVQSPALAWVDLLAEQRKGYPIASAELEDILQSLARHTQISWTALVRAARRRGIRASLDPNRRPVPLLREDIR